VRRSLAIVVAAGVAGCGGSGDRPASVVPKDAAAYVAVDMRSEVADELPQRSWVGERAALFTLGDAEGTALLLETDDTEAAEAYAHEPSVEQAYPASAIVDGHLVLATNDALLTAAREAADGESYKDDESAGLAAFATAAHGADAAEPLARLGVPEPAARLLPDGRFTARVRADGTAMTIDVDGATPRSGAPALDAVPASAWLAIASGDVGADVRAAIPELLDRASQRLGIDTERELLPLLAEGWAYLQHTTDHESGRVFAQLRDDEAMRRAGARVRAAQRRRPRANVDFYRNIGGQMHLYVDWPGLIESPVSNFVATVEDGHVSIELGSPGGDAEDIPDTARYQDAERRLGGPPTLLVDLKAIGGRGYLAARHTDTLRVVLAGRIPRVIDLDAR
jgi:hypothetical protein